jgi:hypothetical protein
MESQIVFEVLEKDAGTGANGASGNGKEKANGSDDKANRESAQGQSPRALLRALNHRLAHYGVKVERKRHGRKELVASHGLPVDDLAALADLIKLYACDLCGRRVHDVSKSFDGRLCRRCDREFWK